MGIKHPTVFFFNYWQLAIKIANVYDNKNDKKKKYWKTMYWKFDLVVVHIFFEYTYEDLICEFLYYTSIQWNTWKLSARFTFA